jgi:hypothetical protein
MTVQAPFVRVAITGEVYWAPTGSTAPTDSVTALNASYKGLGYLSDDGIAEKWDDTVDTIEAWQNATTVRSATTKSTGTMSFTLIETNGLALQTFHRGSVVSGGGSAFTLDVKPITAAPAQWVFHVIDGTKLIRISVKNGEVTERGEVVYKNGSPIAYPMVLMCYPDSSGNLMSKFSNDTAWGYS